LLYDYSAYASRPNVKKKFDHENEQIIEFMKEYKYPYEIVKYDDLVKNKSQYKYALMIDSEKKYITYVEKYGNSSMDSDVDMKAVMVYSLYVINPSEPSKLYLNKRWVANYDISRVIKKFVKFFND